MIENQNSSRNQPSADGANQNNQDKKAQQTTPATNSTRPASTSTEGETDKESTQLQKNTSPIADNQRKNPQATGRGEEVEETPILDEEQEEDITEPTPDAKSIADHGQRDTTPRQDDSQKSK